MRLMIQLGSFIEIRDIIRVKSY